MSTANKLTYLNGTKQAIKQAINEDFEVIDNNTTFREYADEISSNNAKYKDLIPKETKNATNTLDISNSSCLDKALVTLYGNTYQETTVGKNLLGLLPNQSVEVNGVTISTTEEGYLKLNGTATANINKNYNWLVKSSTYTSQQYTYSITYVSGTLSNSFIINIRSGSTTTDMSNQFTPSSYINASGNSTTFTPSGSGYITGIQIIASSGHVFNNFIIKMQIAKGTDTTYEKYSGGNPAPNPDYPQEIQVVSGDNEIDICGKNIINIPNRTYTNSTISVVANDGVLTINGTNSTTGNIIVEFTGINNYTTNQNITMVRNGDDISDGNAQLFLTVDGTEYNMGNQASHPDWRTLSYSGTITRLRLRIAPGASYTNFKIKPMLYLGDYDSSILFEPYKGASYPINIGNIELCKIENYKDRIYPLNGKWYLNKQIGKVVLDGSEDWQSASSIATGTSRFYVDNSSVKYAGEYTKLILSNKFVSATWNEIYETDTTSKNLVASASSAGRIVIRIDNTYASSVADFKTWLRTNQPIVYYVLATPTTTEITKNNYPTLYNQLNNIKLFEGVNHITMTNESGLDVEFDITYYKDWKLD